MIRIRRDAHELIPVTKKRVTWQKNSDGIIKLTIWRNGLIEKYLCQSMNLPLKFDVDLDEFGSFVWQNMDGRQNIMEIIRLTKEKFGKKAEPVYKRVLAFMKQLLNNRLIKLKKPKRKKKTKKKK